MGSFIEVAWTKKSSINIINPNQNEEINCRFKRLKKCPVVGKGTELQGRDKLRLNDTAIALASLRCKFCKITSKRVKWAVNDVIIKRNAGVEI